MPARFEENVADFRFQEPFGLHASRMIRQELRFTVKTAPETTRKEWAENGWCVWLGKFSNWKRVTMWWLTVCRYINTHTHICTIVSVSRFIRMETSERNAAHSQPTQAHETAHHETKQEYVSIHGAGDPDRLKIVNERITVRSSPRNHAGKHCQAYEKAH